MLASRVHHLSTTSWGGLTSHPPKVANILWREGSAVPELPVDISELLIPSTVILQEQKRRGHSGCCFSMGLSQGFIFVTNEPKTPTSSPQQCSACKGIRALLLLIKLQFSLLSAKANIARHAAKLGSPRSSQPPIRSVSPLYSNKFVHGSKSSMRGGELQEGKFYGHTSCSLHLYIRR